MIVKGTTKPFIDICDKPAQHEDRLEMFKYTPCINEKQKELSVCTEKIKDTFFYAIEINPLKRFGSVCCNVKAIQSCTKAKIDELCSVKHSEYQSRLYPMYNLMDAICKRKTLLFKGLWFQEHNRLL